jgi:diguanylate cyclase (GGDEF)-like protein
MVSGLGTVKSSAAFLAIAVLTLVSLLSVHVSSTEKLSAEWKNYRLNAETQLHMEGNHYGERLESIYQNLRTISFLPSVRGLTRQSPVMSGDVRETIQQVYNNLASNIDVSEVYILPASFNPDRLDAATGKKEAPLAAFDELIVQGGRFLTAENPFLAAKGSADLEQVSGPPEIESHEYRQMREQLDWFGSHYKNREDFTGLNSPFVSGEEVLTCDNTVFAKTGDDANRSGVVFSTPFYAENGNFAGMVSAVIRSDALRSILSGTKYRLVSPAGEFESQADFKARLDGASWVPSLFYAEQNNYYVNSVEFFERDSRRKWTMQQKYDSADFYNSAAYRAVRSFAFWSITFIVCFAAFGFFALVLLNNKAVQMRHRATHDALTKLPNRLLLEEKMDEAITLASRGTKAAIFYLDLDRFKLVNDTMGHQAGDEVLCLVAARLQKCVHPDDLVVRIGGDEFVLLLRDVNTTADAMALAKNIILVLSEPMLIHEQDVLIGASIGIAMMQDVRTSASELLRHASERKPMNVVISAFTNLKWMRLAKSAVCWKQI